MMIVEIGHRLMAFGIDQPLARYTSREVRRESRPMLGTSIGTTRRAFVEILHRRGGHPQLALIGGTLDPSTNQSLDVMLQVSERLPLQAATTCVGAFGRNLVPGLPEDFIERVPTALMTRFARPGVITVDRAAYDEVESSVNSFALAADLLAVVLSHESPTDAESVIRQRLSEW